MLSSGKNAEMLWSIIECLLKNNDLLVSHKEIAALMDRIKRSAPAPAPAPSAPPVPPPSGPAPAPAPANFISSQLSAVMLSRTNSTQSLFTSQRNTDVLAIVEHWASSSASNDWQTMISDLTHLSNDHIGLVELELSINDMRDVVPIKVPLENMTSPSDVIVKFIKRLFTINCKHQISMFVTILQRALFVYPSDFKSYARGVNSSYRFQQHIHDQLALTGGGGGGAKKDAKKNLMYPTDFLQLFRQDVHAKFSKNYDQQKNRNAIIQFHHIPYEDLLSDNPIHDDYYSDNEIDFDPMSTVGGGAGDLSDQQVMKMLFPYMRLHMKSLGIPIGFDDTIIRSAEDKQKLLPVHTITPADQTPASKKIVTLSGINDPSDKLHLYTYRQNVLKIQTNHHHHPQPQQNKKPAAAAAASPWLDDNPPTFLERIWTFFHWTTPEPPPATDPRFSNGRTAAAAASQLLLNDIFESSLTNIQNYIRNHDTKFVFFFNISDYHHEQKDDFCLPTTSSSSSWTFKNRAQINSKIEDLINNRIKKMAPPSSSLPPPPPPTAPAATPTP